MPDDVPRFEAVYQPQRRAVLARARNHLLFRALRDEDWVLWLDVDIVEYPRDILQRLIALDLDIVHPHCVTDYGGRSFDLNAWCDNGRVHMDDMRGRGRVRLDSAGGTMLLVRADGHRDGLVFPPFFYGASSRWVRAPNPWRGNHLGEIETEGFAVMAKDMGSNAGACQTSKSVIALERRCTPRNETAHNVDQVMRGKNPVEVGSRAQLGS